VTLQDLIAEPPVEPHPALVAATVATSAQVMRAAYVLGGLYPDVPYLGTLK
jgi:hypothetical protein